MPTLTTGPNELTNHWVPGGLSRSECGREVKLTTHPYLTQGLRMRGVIGLLPSS